MQKLRLHPEAYSELLDAIDHYDHVDEEHGDELSEEVSAAIRHAQRNPQHWPIWNRTGWRKAQVQRFPYLVFFRVVSGEFQVIAIAHAARRPGYWRQRRF